MNDLYSNTTADTHANEVYGTTVLRGVYTVPSAKNN